MKVKDLLDTEDKWTKGFAAITKNGKDCLVTDKNACAYCLWGALRKCYGLNGWQKIYNRIAAYLGISPIKWQDANERTFEDVYNLVQQMDI